MRVCDRCRGELSKPDYSCHYLKVHDEQVELCLECMKKVKTILRNFMQDKTDP